MARRNFTTLALVACCGLLACCVGDAFVAGSGSRGSAVEAPTRAANLEFVQYRAGASSTDVASQSGGLSLLAAAVAFGLVIGFNAPPAKASSVTSIQATAQVADSSVALAMKTFVNPSEELDADEQPFEDWSAEHPVQLILTGLVPVFIYLTFYILGSLEVI
eukprot:TRINITY_DN3981_c0_g2_i1.p1 TRINITY_DN3981_c0_g2~~TRINITY_DN3981_c0_g2_i1.p1  ORF type:complete len:162 (+),score=45.18 TRINITY_DN3981_c0_g2_i1:92-577(+)